MKIIIKGKRGEGKSALAIILMTLLDGLPYYITYTSDTRLQEKDKLECVNNIKWSINQNLKFRDLEIIDTDDNEERY